MEKSPMRRFIGRLKDGIKPLLRWLVPGLGVKRWLVLIIFGTTFLGVGLVIL